MRRRTGNVFLLKRQHCRTSQARLTLNQAAHRTQQPPAPFSTEARGCMPTQESPNNAPAEPRTSTNEGLWSPNLTVGGATRNLCATLSRRNHSTHSSKSAASQQKCRCPHFIMMGHRKHRHTHKVPPRKSSDMRIDS